MALAHTANASQTPEAFTCPVTIATDSRPPEERDPFAENDAVHHEVGLWVTVPETGVLHLSSNQAITFGPLQGWRTETVTWLRDDGVEGFVIVNGERLDAESDLSPQTPLSPQRQYVRVGQVQTGLAFPGEGCWAVTGTVGEHSIRWIVDVRFVDSPDATPGSSTQPHLRVPVDLSHPDRVCNTAYRDHFNSWRPS